MAGDYLIENMNSTGYTTPMPPVLPPHTMPAAPPMPDCRRRARYAQPMAMSAASALVRAPQPRATRRRAAQPGKQDERRVAHGRRCCQQRATALRCYAHALLRPRCRHLLSRLRYAARRDDADITRHYSFDADDYYAMPKMVWPRSHVMLLMIAFFFIAIT